MILDEYVGPTCPTVMYIMTTAIIDSLITIIDAAIELSYVLSTSIFAIQRCETRLYDPRNKLQQIAPKNINTVTH